ncbi:OmpA family protein [Pandoraea soli]|uniref:Membrane protein n=1 Tax=Pandoraea soli TaxID=2508293 RepID=A0ABY6WA51_9BURK|nr:OmpA family protein [Pandoraea soli]VVE45265.1 membrane protein [Pandoraea soli]
MKFSKFGAIVGIGACLAGCGTVPTTGPDGGVAFPDRDRAWLKEGTFVNVENLRQMAPGLNKTQVYALLKEPHFDEGVIGVRVWNYIFDFRTGHGNDFISCQYQVQYDENRLVKATYWKEPECEKYVNPTPVAAATPAPVKRITLDASLLFGFNKFALSDLRPEGRAKLDSIAASLSDNVANGERIKVAGYTDRIGSEAYNQQLSLHRAQTVRDYFASRGIDARRIDAIGMGSANPVSAGCPDGRSTAALQCLAVDRRVTIETVPVVANQSH